MQKLLEKLELAILGALYACVFSAVAKSYRPDEAEQKAKESVEFIKKKANS